MNDTERFFYLKKKEVVTVFLICIGKTNADISLMLQEDEKTTASRITRIYKKLEIGGEGEEKRYELQRRFAPIVRKHIKSQDDFIFWVPKKPSKAKSDADNKIDNDNPLIGNNENEDFIPLLPFGSTKQLPPIEPPERRFGDILKWIVIIGLLLVVGYLLITKYIPSGTTLIPDFQAPENPLNITQIPQASVTPEETSTSANTLTEASKPTILFEDNFDKGISPDWRDEDGNPFTGNDPYTVDGKLTTKNGFTARFGDETWKNYKIQFTVYDWVCSSYKNISVGVRAKDKNNMLALFGMACHQDWNEVINGKWTPIPHAEVAGGNTPYKYELIVTGDDYQLVGSPNLNYKGYPNGMIYLFMTPGRIIDDFKITQLP